MYFFIIYNITLIINLYISIVAQATCNKFFKIPENNNGNLLVSSPPSSTLAPLSSSSLNFYFKTRGRALKVRSIESSATSGEAENIYNGSFSTPTNINNSFNSTASDNSENQDITEPMINTNDLGNQLRLEYYKYKILNQLGMSINQEVLDSQAEIRLKILNNFRESEEKKKLLKQLDSDYSTNSRHKRSLACNQVKSNKDACCLETLYVNFTEIGWDKWIVYPPGYHANYCRGQCDLSHSRYYHSTLLSKFSNVIGLCCSPKQMAPLNLLYMDEENKIHQRTMPDMIVQGCDCA